MTTDDEQRERAKELQRMANYAATAKRIVNRTPDEEFLLSRNWLEWNGWWSHDDNNPPEDCHTIEAALQIERNRVPLAGREEDDSD